MRFPESQDPKGDRNESKDEYQAISLTPVKMPNIVDIEDSRDNEEYAKSMG